MRRPKKSKISQLLKTYEVKMTQINFISRNQLHNTANSFQHLNFGLSWPGYLGAKCKGKTLLVIEIFFALHRDCTITA
jgi:hypothetical protein